MRFGVSNVFVNIGVVIACALIVTACAVTGGKTGDKTGETEVRFAATDSAPGFGVSVELPDGWSIGGEAESYYPGLDGDTAAIVDADGNEVGMIGSGFYPDYSEMEDPSQYPEPFSENYYQAVYPELRLPAHRSWDIDPATSIRTDVGETMLATVYTQIPDDNEPAAMWETVETRGVVSYDDEYHVYVFIELYSASDDELALIADTLSFDK